MQEPSNEVVDQLRYKQLAQGAEVKQHLIIDTDGLDSELVYPYRAIVEAVIKGEVGEWSTIKVAIASYFTTRMRWFGNVNPKYAKYIKGVNELGVLAQEGVKVNTIINTLLFDFNHLWMGLNKLTKGRLSKNKKQLTSLDLYPVVNFDQDFKKYIYSIFNQLCPGLMQVIIKNKLMLYITSDFNFAASSDLADIKPNSVQLPVKIDDHYDIGSHVKLYVADHI